MILIEIPGSGVERAVFHGDVAIGATILPAQGQGDGWERSGGAEERNCRS